MNSNRNSKFEAGYLGGLVKMHRECGHESDLVRLEYLYYTDLDLKGEALAEDLKKLSYEAEVDATHRKCDCTRVFGKTTLLRNGQDSIKKWYLEMRDVGNYHDCDFICYRIIENPAMNVDEILNNKQVVSEEKFESGKEAQESGSRQLMKVLRDLNDCDEEELVLEFFFYTDDRSKAESLSEVLLKYGYVVHIDELSKSKLRFSITGRTIPLPNEDDVVEKWAMKMNELGFIHDCEFDGWGSPDVKGGWFSDDTPDEVIRKRLGLPPMEE